MIVVGVSGPSSSGKTTLSRALRDLFESAGVPTVLVHEDDFYLDEQSLPFTPSGQRDWDSASSLNLPSLVDTLQYIRSHDGVLPPELHSIEDQQNASALSMLDVPSSVKKFLRHRILESSVPLSHTRLAILDGFLLYGEPVAAIAAEVDVKLFLRTDYTTVKTRREKRGGYVTRLSAAAGEDVRHADTQGHEQLDARRDIVGDGTTMSNGNTAVSTGYWVDPPGYFDEVVWPNYIRDHAFLFKNGNVEGNLDHDGVERDAIHAMEGFYDGSSARGCEGYDVGDTIAGSRGHDSSRDGDEAPSAAEKLGESRNAQNEEEDDGPLAKTLRWAVAVILEQLSS
ncbi:MAG: ribosylnicotinamide kinase [Lichina confinis]|nr:MAG: ribosylnicotinamide kinase [Lichina confinis]